MELINYVGLRVKLILTNQYYYIGKVLCADEHTLDLRDFKGHLVSIRKDSISSIQEITQ